MSDDDPLVKARKVCLGYFCDRAARCGLYIQRVADTRPIRHWMSSHVGADCHHFIAAPDLDHPAAQEPDLEGGIA